MVSTENDNESTDDNAGGEATDESTTAEFEAAGATEFDCEEFPARWLAKVSGCWSVADDDGAERPEAGGRCNNVWCFLAQLRHEPLEQSFARCVPFRQLMHSPCFFTNSNR